MGCCLFDCIGGIVRTIFRWGLLLLNVFFVLAGIALIAMGSIIFINTDEWDEFYTEESQLAAILCISGGCGTIVFACLGFFGALKKKSVLLFAYTGLMVLSFGCLLAGGICAFTYEDDYTVEVRENMQELLDSAKGGNTTSMEAWNQLHKDYKCCGLDSARDWLTGVVAQYPDSCKCEQNSDGCGAIGVLFIYSSGCYAKLQTYVFDLKTGLGGLAFTVSGLEFIAGFVSLCLAGSFKNSKRQGSISS